MEPHGSVLHWACMRHWVSASKRYNTLNPKSSTMIQEVPCKESHRSASASFRKSLLSSRDWRGHRTQGFEASAHASFSGSMFSMFRGRFEGLDTRIRTCRRLTLAILVAETILLATAVGVSNPLPTMLVSKDVGKCQNDQHVRAQNQVGMLFWSLEGG